jgi:putative ABC transport system ATP-binding protein
VNELRLENVSKVYARGRRTREALHQVSFEVHPAEFVAIHGEPRSGKSTLLRVAAGIEAPDSGRVIFGGRDLVSMSDRELSDYRLRSVAWVSSARPAFPGYRALDFVALPRLAAPRHRRDAHARAHEALELTGADELGDATLDELSESEAQRVAIAQAVVRCPRIVLADEPAAGLGVTEARAILDLLRGLSQQHGMGVLLTASDASELLGANRVLGLLVGGRLVAPPAPANEGADLVHFPRRPRTGDA